MMRNIRLESFHEAIPSDAIRKARAEALGLNHLK